MKERLNPEQNEILKSIEEDAIAMATENGRIDHVSAAHARRDALQSLEAAGTAWAATVRDSAEQEGHIRRIKARAKAVKVTLPSLKGDGPKVSMPAAYSQRDSDGGQQLALWLHMSLADLAILVSEIEKQSSVLSERAAWFRLGLEYAKKHGVATAAEGFAAEGISYDQIEAAS